MSKYIFVISSLSGGVGRVVSVLAEAFSNLEIKVEIIPLEHSGYDSMDIILSEKVKIIDPKYIEVCSGKTDVFFAKALILTSKIINKVKRILFKRESEYASILKFYSQNYFLIKCLKNYFSMNKKANIIAFLNKPIFLTLLSKQKDNKVIISERNDPSKFVDNKTTMAFIHKIYHKSDCMVFQSPDAQKWYNNNSSVKGRVIFNPIKPDLPSPYIGDRRKRIVNFCRISSQKNLELLIDAFVLFEKDFPDYELYIYGDESGNGADGYLDRVKQKIANTSVSKKIHILPAIKDIHKEILDYAMFVSSSDFEGMSNSMIEAMAIGLPTICTDCPAGGARAVIKDHENGLLVPVGDVDSMYKAMKELAENKELAQKTSANATQLRVHLSVDKIVNQWLNIS